MTNSSAPTDAGETARRLGLPDGIRACLFDLDGVLTDTAAVHQAAWKQMFDAFLQSHGSGDTRPFTADDYLEFVDGKPRAAGVRDFLASRGIQLPEGGDTDAADASTVRALGDRKNALVQERISKDGVRTYDGSVRYLEAVAAADVPRAVVSSSANTAQVLGVTGLDRLIEIRVDGVTAQQEGLAGKPAPDTFLAGAARLAVPASAAAVFEDAVSGVAAGRAGAFGFVVGVDRTESATQPSDHAKELSAHGADVVVRDLSELLAAPSAPEGASA